MTILIDARPLVDPLQGGVTRVSQGLLPALVQAMPHDHLLFLTTGMKKPSLTLDRHLHITLPNKIWSSRCILRQSSLDHLIHPIKPDLLFLPNLGFIGRPTYPYALLVHDISFLIEPRWFGWKARLWHHAVQAQWLIEHAAMLFTVSERTKKDLLDLLQIPEHRITVIPLGLEVASPIQDLPPLLEYTRYVLALGGNNKRKNAVCAIQATKELRKIPDYQDIRLVLLGTTPKQSYPDFVLSLGHPSDRARDTLFRHASAFLYPSWYEGFGLPLHEAARFQTPCISSTAGALPETAPTGTLFATPNKPHHWMKAMEMILKKPEVYSTHTHLTDWKAAAHIVQEKLATIGG